MLGTFFYKFSGVVILETSKTSKTPFSRGLFNISCYNFTAKRQKKTIISQELFLLA